MTFSKSLISKLKEELAYLDEQPRLAIYYRFWHEMTILEISKLLGISWKSTDRLISESLSELRIKLDS